MFSTMLIILILIVAFVLFATRNYHENNPGTLTDRNTSNLNDSESSRTYDDIVYKDGQYIDNENSEEWEDFEYEYDEDHRH